MSDNEGGEKENKKSWITEGIVLALCSAAAYLAAYSYECGYAGYFGIPLEWISIDARSLIVFASLLVGALVLMIQITQLGLTLCPSDGWIAQLLTKHGFFFALMFLIALGSADSIWDWMELFLFPMLNLCSDIIIPAVIAKRKGRSFHLTMTDWMSAGGVDASSWMKKLEPSLHIPFAMVILACMLLVVASSLGKGEARWKTDFVVIDPDQKVDADK